jgi:competence protein ComEC
VGRVLLYAGILILLVSFGKRFARPFRYLILAGGILILVWRSGGGLTITFLDVGQGDCIHISSPSGRQYLIDGGSLDQSRVGEYRIIPYLKSQGVSRLDALFITHADRDHCGALPALIDGMQNGGIAISVLVLPDIQENGKEEAYRALESMAREAGIGLRYIGRGQGLREEGFILQCLHPASGGFQTDGNAASMVLRVRYGAFSALFTGDIEEGGEYELNRYLDAAEKVTVLKVSHHGSRFSTGTAFLQQTHPVYAVISAGYGNPYGHPHQELLQRLEQNGSKVYITYESGAVMIRTDGETMKVTVNNAAFHTHVSNHR